MPLALRMTGLTCATSASATIAARSRFAAGSSVGDVTFAASSSGPLKPFPNPSVSRSYARRVVSFVGSFPASATPRRNAKNGSARTTRMTSPAIAAVHGRR